MSQDITIGQYDILEKIGVGGMATVYRAHQRKLDRSVAVKIMHQTISQDENFLARFEREARIIAKLDHPYIVPIYDYDMYEGQPYLVMKYVDGHTLKAILRQGPVPPREVLRILERVGSALEYAHQQGILHRDIKPSNIMMDTRGEVYLMDFGLARASQSGESTMSADVMLGTPHYISPEQAQGNKDLDSRTDVYSLGVVLYELVTGRVPFMGDTSYGIIHAQITEKPPAPRDINPNIPPSVESVLFKALDKNRDRRYATPMALVNAYREAIEGASEFSPIIQIAPKEQTPADMQPNVFVERLDKVIETWAEESQIHDLKSNDKGKKSWEASVNFNSRPVIHITSKEGKVDIDTVKTDEDAEDAVYKDDPNMTTEQNLRVRVERKIRARSKAQGELFMHALIYLGVNHFIFNWTWFIALFWGFGLFGQFMEYMANYGFIAMLRERQIDREVARERKRLYGYDSGVYAEKAKNYEENIPIRLTDDGELTPSIIDEISSPSTRKKS
ncbi:MAG: protein kinase [Phototrophicales bacterium]|nr:protein kinase [Phototrophicales bacterium]